MTTAHLMLSVAVLLFCIGAATFCVKRNAVVALMGIEVMLNAVNLILVVAGQLHQDPQGTSLALFIVLVAAAEAALALSIFVILFRKYGTLTLDNYRAMKG